jgi:copper chaperone CopZ
MESKTVKVPNIGCNGCVQAIKGELGELDGMIRVDGAVDTKMVTVEYNAPTNWETIVSTLKSIDYAPENA